jgi:cell division protein FtsZ
MGIGSARGEDRSVAAAELAISSPLLEASIDGAYGVLLSVSGGSDLGLFEIHEAANLVSEAAHPEANIIFGAVIDDALGDEVRVTVIAAGFEGGAPKKKEERPGRKGETSGLASKRREPANGATARGREQAASSPATDEAPASDAAAAPTQRPAPRVLVPDTNDDLDVPDFLK